VRSVGPLVAVLIFFFVRLYISWSRRRDWRSREKLIYFSVVILTMLFTGVMAYLYTASHAVRAR
jgi:hypothetical protein